MKRSLKKAVARKQNGDHQKLCYCTFLEERGEYFRKMVIMILKKKSIFEEIQHYYYLGAKIELYFSFNFLKMDGHIELGLDICLTFVKR